MIKLFPFSKLVNAYPILDHTVIFGTIGVEWQRLFEQYPDLPELFNSLRNSEGVFSISREAVFSEQNVRGRVLKTLIWGFPNGYRGMRTLSKIMANMDRITAILGHLQQRYTQAQMCELYRELKSIPGLGASTIAKLFYFFKVRIANFDAVIIDSNVLKAIPAISEMKKCPNDNSPESYYQQVGYINRISTRCNIDRPDKLEYFLFNYGKSIK